MIKSSFDGKFVIRKGDGTAVFFVDGDIAFIRPDGRLYTPGGQFGEVTVEQSINNAVEMGDMECWDDMATSEDMHCEDHEEFKKYGPHSVSGSFDQPYHPILQRLYKKADHRLFKGMEKHLVSLSAGQSPQFSLYIADLRRKGIKRIVGAGWLLTHCLGLTMIDLKTQGFEIIIVRDATCSFGDPAWMENILTQFGIQFVNFEQIEAVNN